MKRMMHPEHGYHFPINSADRAEMIKAGWVDDEQGIGDPKEEPSNVAELPPAIQKMGLPKK